MYRLEFNSTFSPLSAIVLRIHDSFHNLSLHYPAMPRYKKKASRLKILSRFQGYKAEETLEEFIELRKILDEKGFQFPTQPSGIIYTIHTAAAIRGWLEFCRHSRDPVLPIVKEFYANVLGQDQWTTWVRNTQVPLNLSVINAFYNLPSNVDCEY